MSLNVVISLLHYFGDSVTSERMREETDLLPASRQGGDCAPLLLLRFSLPPFPLPSSASPASVLIIIPLSHPRDAHAASPGPPLPPAPSSRRAAASASSSSSSSCRSRGSARSSASAAAVGLELVDVLAHELLQVRVLAREEQHVVGGDGGAAGVAGEALEVDGDVFCRDSQGQRVLPSPLVSHSVSLCIYPTPSLPPPFSFLVTHLVLRYMYVCT